MRQAVLVDDERLARRRLRRLLERSGAAHVLAECSNGPEAVEVLRGSTADVVFLDVQMPVLDGFEVIETVGREAMPPVVFVTAFEEYAIRAFEANALDYLVKPIAEARLERTFSRLDRRLRDPQTSDEIWRRLSALLRQHRSWESRPRFSVKEGERIIILPADEVDFIRSEGNYVQLHAGSRRYLLRETMERLEAKLDEQFVRIHRSTIVRVDRIMELCPLQSGELELKLKGGARLTVSRRYRSNLGRLLP